MNKYFLFIILKYKYKMNFNLILIICIIIIIICIIILNNNKYENYENNTTLDALNNITDMIKNDEITSKNITNTNTIKSSNIELKLKDKNEFVDILDLIYPVGSIYITTNETNANKFLNCKNWKWEKYNENYYLKTSNEQLGETTGDNLLKANNLPKHKHKFQRYPYRGSDSRGKRDFSGDQLIQDLTYSDIYDESGKKIEKQEPYYPASINIICYKRIE